MIYHARNLRITGIKISLIFELILTDAIAFSFVLCLLCPKPKTIPELTSAL